MEADQPYDGASITRPFCTINQFVLEDDLDPLEALAIEQTLYQGWLAHRLPQVIMPGCRYEIDVVRTVDDSKLHKVEWTNNQAIETHGKRVTYTCIIKPQEVDLSERQR